MTGKRYYQVAPKKQYTPAYSIIKLEGDYEQTVAKMVPLSNKKDKNGNQSYKLTYQKIRKPRGYLVETPLTRGGYHRNGTVHIETFEELEELGLAGSAVPLVDSDGEPVDSIPLTIKKDKA